MKTLTVSEAAANLGNWLKRAIAGEEISIRSDDRMVTLHPVPAGDPTGGSSPRAALQQLQSNAHLTPAEAGSYLREVKAERTAAEKH